MKACFQINLSLFEFGRCHHGNCTVPLDFRQVTQRKRPASRPLKNNHSCPHPACKHQSRTRESFHRSRGHSIPAVDLSLLGLLFSAGSRGDPVISHPLPFQPSPSTLYRRHPPHPRDARSSGGSQFDGASLKSTSMGSDKLQKYAQKGHPYKSNNQLYRLN